MNKLGKRLEVIASLVDCKRIADVGCDHGKLAYYLLDNGISDYAVVSDISRPSLNKAVDILSKTKYNFDYICCDGLYRRRILEQNIRTIWSTAAGYGCRMGDAIS